MSSSRVEALLAALVAALFATACADARGPATRAAAPATERAPRAASVPVTTRAAAVQTAKPAPGPFTLAAAGLHAPIPRGWKTTRRDGALVFEGPMRVPSVAVFEASHAELGDAVRALPAQVAGAITGVRVTQRARPATLAGYEASIVEGTGRAEGFPMRWRATVVEAERTTVFLALAPSFLWGARQGAIQTFKQGVARRSTETASLAVSERVMR